MCKYVDGWSCQSIQKSKKYGTQLMNYNRAVGCIISVYCYYELCPIDICAQR